MPAWPPSSAGTPKRGNSRRSVLIHGDLPFFQALVPKTRAESGRYLKASARQRPLRPIRRPVAGNPKPMRVSLPLRGRWNSRSPRASGL
jgi:hypothetical protein